MISLKHNGRYNSFWFDTQEGGRHTFEGLREGIEALRAYSSPKSRLAAVFEQERRFQRALVSAATHRLALHLLGAQAVKRFKPDRSSRQPFEDGSEVLLAYPKRKWVGLVTGLLDSQVALKLAEVSLPVPLSYNERTALEEQAWFECPYEPLLATSSEVFFWARQWVPADPFSAKLASRAWVTDVQWWTPLPGFHATLADLGSLAKHSTEP